MSFTTVLLPLALILSSGFPKATLIGGSSPGITVEQDHQLAFVLLADAMTANQVSTLSIMLRAMGFFNEADILESSSILIYSHLQMGLYTQ